jgi:glycosyltransferase involved in cell wall biosynthesis
MADTARDASSAGLPAASLVSPVLEVLAPQGALDLPPDPRNWLHDFERRHGRPLRVLHVGNIANNAYLNAKFLNKAGVHCDVMCFDYYHIMGCPEWEDVDFDEVPSDQFQPDWTTVGLGGYERPRWFAQGPQGLCIDYLLARVRGFQSLTNRLWQDLGYSNRTRVRPHRKALSTRWAELRIEVMRLLWAASWPEKLSQRLEQIALAELRLDRLRRLIPPPLERMIRASSSLQRVLRWISGILTAGFNTVVRTISCVARVLFKVMYGYRVPKSDDNYATATGLVQRFRTLFPDRSDMLSTQDVAPFQMLAPLWKELFSQYDIVQAYAVDPIYPLITGVRPYVCFEHGTLRDFTMGDDPLHRLTALAYREADHVFVTNGDCLAHAERLGIPSYSPMIHPVDIEQHERVDEKALSGLRAEFSAEVLLFCPIRHDWSVKGTDVHIRALPLIRTRVQGQVILVMANWGNQVKDSAALARELGCESNIVWMPPFNRERMVKLLQAADVVLDQMALPHFGGTAPQALAAGTPVIMSYEPESTKWIVDEPAPILAAFSPEEVAAAVEQALDPEWRRSFKKRARAWTHRHHSPARVVRDHLTVYRNLIEGRPVNRAEARARGRSGVT